MAHIKSLDLASANAWFKSSFSGNGNNCIEVAALGASVGVRDSKELNGPAFVVASTAFAGFVSAVKAGTFSA
ncbi:DUF397 domain-containing protein [Streptomyces sp. NPDC001927]